MAVTRKLTGGFDEAHLSTENDAHLYCRLEWDCGEPVFRVAMEPLGQHRDDWIFDEAACREAAGYFTELADELKRRMGHIDGEPG